MLFKQAVPQCFWEYASNRVTKPGQSSHPKHNGDRGLGYLTPLTPFPALRLGAQRQGVISSAHPWWLRQWERILQCRRPRFNHWVGKIPWRREWQPTPGFLPGKSHGQRSQVGYSPWAGKESDMTDWLTLALFHFHFPGDSEGRGSLACYSPWGHKELDTTKRLYNNDICISFHPKA